MFFFEGITVRNFKSLNCVTLGLDTHGFGKPLTAITCCVGAPNSGKSNFLDVFQFIRDANEYGINQALNKRGGFGQVRTVGKYSPISFEFLLADVFGNKYRYVLSIDQNNRGDITRKERLTTRHPWGSADLKDYANRVPTIFNNVYVPEFTEEALCAKINYGTNFRLTKSGDNFISVMKRKSGFKEDRDFFASYINHPLDMQRCVPIVEEGKDEFGGHIEIQKMKIDFKDNDYYTYPDDRLKVSFNTLSYIAYLVMCRCFNDFDLMCIEHPEQGIYYTVVEYLGEALKSSAVNTRTSVFMTTYSQFILSNLRDEDVFVFYRNAVGHTEIVRANAIPYVHSQMQDGNNLGYLWSQGMLRPDNHGNFPNP